MYKVKANVLDNQMHTLATNSIPDDVSVVSNFTADITAYKSVSIIQHKFIREPVSTTAVTSVDYPNILATDIVHPQTGEPLFYYHKIPKVTSSGKGIAEYISIADQNGNTVDSSKYFVVTTKYDTRIYTNLMNSENTLYFVNAIFFKNTARMGYINNMLNVHKALEYNTDYIVTYTNGAYTLDRALYVTSDPDRMETVLIPYDYDINTPWRLEIPPLVMPTYIVGKSHIVSSVFGTDAIKLSGGIYRVDTYDISDVRDDNGYVKSFDSYGYIYAPKATDDTLHVTIVRKNSNQFISNISGDSSFYIYCVNGITIKLTEDRTDLQKVATVYVNKNGSIEMTNASATGGGFTDDDSDEFKPTLFTKLSNMKLRTTADRSTYDATYPISNGIVVAQIPISYSSSLGKGDSQRLTDTIAQSKATGNELLLIDSNGFEVTKGYFAKTFSEIEYIRDSANVPNPVEEQDATTLTDDTIAILDSPYESAVSTVDSVSSTFANNYDDLSNMTENVLYSGNINKYAETSHIVDSASINIITSLTDIAKTDHDVVY